jgi:hypothetical protein
MAVSSGGSINNSGTIILKGNLQNLNSGSTNLGTGTFNFNGTSSQTISGTNTMGTMIVNNSTGVILGGNTTVNTNLTLTSGLLTLGSNNLILAPLASITGGSSSSMVVAEGTGQMQEQISANGTLTFPVGDNTGTAEYSPVTLAFTSGTYAGGAYASVNLTNSPYPGMTGDYIKRYWTINSIGITSFNCNSQFNYNDPADIQGSEANIYCIRVSPNMATYSLANAAGNYLTANGLSSFGVFTGGHGVLQTALTVFLQGPYSTSNHNMNNTLATVLPLGSRSDNTKFPNQQPYNGAPWNYSGSENIATIPSNVVDWVLVDLRHASSPANAHTSSSLGKQAGLLLKNGSIVALDGLSAIQFTNLASYSDNLYPVIYHRNHMPIIAGNAATKDANQIVTYNYSTSSSQIYGGANGCIQVDSSPVRWAMMAGDASNDGAIFLNDMNTYWIPFSGYMGNYLLGDFNMDANVFLNDINTYWIPNSGFMNPLP